MKSFSILLNVDSSEELAERLEEAARHLRDPVQRRFVDRMEVDEMATFGDPTIIDPVEMTRHE